MSFSWKLQIFHSKSFFSRNTQRLFTENRKGKQSVRLSAEHDYYRAVARTHYTEKREE